MIRIQPPVSASIRGITREMEIPGCPDTRDKLGIYTVAEIRQRLETAPDFDAVVAELRQGGKIRPTRFAAVMDNGTVGEFHMAADGRVRGLWMYSKLNHFPAKR